MMNKQVRKSETEKRNLGNRLNNMLDEMKEKEKKFDKLYDLEHNEDCVIEKKSHEREENWKICLQKIFDSNKDKLSKDNSQFDQMMLNKTHVVILIETTEGKKFGCYVAKVSFDYHEKRMC